jgi:hypothetical protein
MDQRIEFVMRAMRTANFRALCAEYGISAKTGYKWQRRLLQYGLAGMAEQSRRRRSHADNCRGVVCEMVRPSGAPALGPRKIRAPAAAWHAARRSAGCCGAGLMEPRRTGNGRRNRAAVE